MVAWHCINTNNCYELVLTLLGALKLVLLSHGNFHFWFFREVISYLLPTHWNIARLWEFWLSHAVTRLLTGSFTSLQAHYIILLVGLSLNVYFFRSICFLSCFSIQDAPSLSLSLSLSLSASLSLPLSFSLYFSLCLSLFISPSLSIYLSIDL